MTPVFKEELIVGHTNISSVYVLIFQNHWFLGNWLFICVYWCLLVFPDFVHCLMKVLGILAVHLCAFRHLGNI